MKYIKQHNQVIAVTGGIGSGKSFIIKCFKEMGYLTYSYDHIINNLYRKHGEIYEKLKHLYSGYIDDIGINKQLVANKVFNDKDALKQLEDIIHPIIRKHFSKFCKDIKHKSNKTIVVEIPLLFETASHIEFDIIISSFCPVNIRKERALLRPYMTEERFNTIINSQVDDKYRISNSDIIVETKHGYLYTFKQIKKLLRYANKRDCTRHRDNWFKSL